jgi:hypothetical protein
MRESKKKTVGAVSDLNRRIDRCIELKNEIAEREAELKAERDAIMGTMQNADLTRYASAAGNEALRVTSESVTWNVAALEAALSDDEMDELCPRKAESAKLRKL